MRYASGAEAILRIISLAGGQTAGKLNSVRWRSILCAEGVRKKMRTVWCGLSYWVSPEKICLCAPRPREPIRYDCRYIPNVRVLVRPLTYNTRYFNKYKHYFNNIHKYKTGSFLYTTVNTMSYWVNITDCHTVYTKFIGSKSIDFLFIDFLTCFDTKIHRFFFFNFFRSTPSIFGTNEKNSQEKSIFGRYWHHTAWYYFEDQNLGLIFLFCLSILTP